MNIEQPLDNMTWGELRAFVALSDEPDADEVTYDYDDQMQPRSIFITSVDPASLSRNARAGK